MFWYWQRPKTIFFRNKTFLFIKIESWTLASVWKVIAWNLTNFNSIKQPIENNNFLNELKFFEVSQNSISDRCRKFQLSILKNKKVLFLKIIFFWALSLNMPRSAQKMALAVLIFSYNNWMRIHNKISWRAAFLLGTLEQTYGQKQMSDTEPKCIYNCHYSNVVVPKKYYVLLWVVP